MLILARRSIVLLMAALAAFPSARGDEGCHKLVGKSLFVDRSTPPLNFAEKRSDGIYLNQHVAGGEKLEVTGLIVGDNTDDDLTIHTQDGRTLNMMCSPFEDAMGPDPIGQRIIESDAPDFKTAMARVRAKRRAGAKAAALRERQRLARGGVRVGMTEQQVLASSWGTPDHRNRTITASGETEQWVYGGQNFLYFTNGILKVIQTE